MYCDCCVYAYSAAKGKHTDIMIYALYGISYQKANISFGKANIYLQKALIMRGKETKWNREKRLTL